MVKDDAKEAAAAARLRFDLTCSERGRVVVDSPSIYKGSFPDWKHWRLHETFVIDLPTGTYCDTSCSRLGIFPITRVSGSRIYLSDKPSARTWIDWRAGRYYQRIVDLGRVTVVTGVCRSDQYRPI